MLKQLVTISILGAAMCTIGCGKDKKEGGESAAKAAPEAQGPALDCTGFTTKMTECLDAFAPVYAVTENGKAAGKQLDGTYDTEMATNNFKSLWNIKGEALCTEDYSNKDGRWKERFVKCDNTAACEVWVPCMSTAVGELLP